MHKHILLSVSIILSTLLVPAFALAKTVDKTPPSIESLSVTSSNANPAEAKVGDTITISLVASEKINPPIILVDLRPFYVKPTNTSGNAWSASYVVSAKDHEDKLAYLITLIDPSNNIYICSSVHLLFFPLCMADGSSITVDKTPPTISSHADVFATTTNASGAAVSYTLPTATDTKDGSVAVSCTPTSGSLFAIGTTTVNCAAHDTAGNIATSSFKVGVSLVVQGPPPRVPYTMASQSDESYLCAPDWQQCFTGPASSSPAIINLGLGSTLGGGALQSVTIAKDPTSPFVSQLWSITIDCHTDAAYTQTCPDWVAGNSWNVNQHYFVFEQATSTTDNKHWVAYFANPAHETNFDGSAPVTFNPAYYYRLVIDDNGWNIGAYGSQSLQEPYFVVNGVTQ